MHWFLDPILNHYSDFRGRATRQQYWMFVLYNVIVSLALWMLIFISPIFAIIFIISMFGILIPSLAIVARRFHDIGMSGWWQLIQLVPFGGLVLLFFMIKKGDEGPNKFGPNPNSPASVAEMSPIPTNDVTSESTQVENVPPQTPPVSEGQPGASSVEENKQQGYRS